MPDFQIMGLTRVNDHTPNKNRDLIVAFFDVNIGEIEIRGCALVRRHYADGRSKGLIWWPPKLDDGNTRRGITFAPDLRNRIKRAASDIFGVFGGDVPDEECD